MNNLVAGIRVPDTRLIQEATEIAREASEPFLFHHVMRSYYFGELFGQVVGLSYDRELLYVSAVLHDLGLTERFAGPLRFEVDGANAARAFLAERGVPKEKMALVWDAIALHTSLGIAEHKEPEVAITHIGISMDYGGFALDKLPKEAVAEVLRAYPRLEMKTKLQHALCRVVERKPHTSFGNFLTDFGRRYVPDFQEMSPCDALAGAPFDS